MRKQLYFISVALAVVTMLTFLLFEHENKLYTTEEALSDYDKIKGKIILVEGAVVQGSTACTQMACQDNSCCNTCKGSVKLGKNSSILLKGEKIGCSGKSCNITCKPEENTNYAIKGYLNQSYGQKYLQVKNYRRIKK